MRSVNMPVFLPNLMNLCLIKTFAVGRFAGSFCKHNDTNSYAHVSAQPR